MVIKPLGWGCGTSSPSWMSESGKVGVRRVQVYMIKRLRLTEVENCIEGRL
jgi:hypothetical protein